MRVTLYGGDCIARMQTLADNVLEAIVTDPPYLIGFMSREWDCPDLDGTEEASPDVAAVHASQAWHVRWLTEAFRVLKPGGAIKVFSATRTFHRLAAAMETVGFENLSLTAWAYGCLSEDTEILTPEGWVPYHKAKSGSRVMGFDLTTGDLSWQVVEETFEYPYDGTAFRIVGTCTDQIVSTGHRCIIWDGGWRFVRSETLTGTEALFPYLESMPNMQQTLPGLSAPAGLFQDLSGGETPQAPNPEERLRGLSQALPTPVRKSQDLQLFVSQQAKEPQEKTPIGTERDRNSLYRLRQDEVVSERLVEESQRTNVLQTMQRDTSRTGLGQTWVQGINGSLQGRQGISHSENDGFLEPVMERRSDLFQEAWELREERADQVSSMPQGISVDGSQGWLRDGTPADRSPSVGATVDAERNGTSREPQPGGQQIGESVVVCLESGSQIVRAPRETLAPVARMPARVEPIPYRGVVWCVRVPTGAFVVRRGGMAFITGNSGFPKSLNVSKSIDKHLGASDQREVIGYQQGVGGENLNDIVNEADEIRSTDDPGGKGVGAYGTGAKQVAITIPVTKAATPEARQFEGWGTALKPAWEAFVVGRKPL